MIAPDRITSELDAALKDYTAGNDCAVRFVTIDQVDMLAEFYLHNRATEAKLAKAVEAVSLTVRADNLREAYHALPNDHNRIGDKRSRKGHAREAWLRAFRKAAKTSRATLAEIEGTNAP
jgi:hypothetical protein